MSHRSRVGECNAKHSGAAAAGHQRTKGEDLIWIKHRKVQLGAGELIRRALRESKGRKKYNTTHDDEPYNIKQESITKPKTQTMTINV